MPRPDVVLGPADGALTLHTGREGVGSKVGHDLVIAIGQWSGVATFGDAAVPTGLELTAHLPSLAVLRGDGGLKPLSDKDRRTIRDNALKSLRATQHPDVTFTASDVRQDGSRVVAKGTLTLAGNTQPIEVVLEGAERDGRTRITAEVPVRQTEFGITPYSGLLGALKVADVVRVQLDVTAVGTLT